MRVEGLRDIEVVGDEVCEPLLVWIRAREGGAGDAYVGAAVRLSVEGMLWLWEEAYAEKKRPFAVKTVM